MVSALAYTEKVLPRFFARALNFFFEREAVFCHTVWFAVMFQKRLVKHFES